MDRSLGTRAPTRRAVLAGGAAALGGALGFAGAGTAQETVVGVVSSPEQWEDDNVAGFLLHVGPAVEPEPDTEVPGCDFGEWPPDNVDPYNATLVNRKDAEVPQEEVILYVATDAEVNAGALFLINEFGTCESDYVGVELLLRGRDDIGTIGRSVDIEDDERPNEETQGDGLGSAIGPGFGAVGALAGAAGLGGLLARRRRE